MREKETASVVSQESIGTDIYSMVIKTKAAKEARAGQFISMYCNDICPDHERNDFFR